MIGYGKKAVTVYHGDNRPAEIYGPKLVRTTGAQLPDMENAEGVVSVGLVKYAGWKEECRSGSDLTFEGTYHDVLTSLAVDGKSVQVSSEEILLEGAYVRQFFYETSGSEDGAGKSRIESLSVYGHSTQEDSSPLSPQEPTYVCGEVRSEGGNLLKPGTFSARATVSGIYHHNNRDGTYTLTGTSDSAQTAFGVLTVARFQTLEPGKYVLYGGHSDNLYIQLKGVEKDIGIANDFGNHPEFTLEEPTAIRFNIRVKTEGTVLDHVLVAPMIVRAGLRVPAYIPYSEPSRFAVPPLYALPDGTRDILRVDRTQKRAWVERHIQKTALNGTETWELPTGRIQGFSEYRVTVFFPCVPSSAMCSHFPCKVQTEYSRFSRNILTSFNQTRQLIILVSNDIADSQGQISTKDWKAWLAARHEAGTPVAVYYPLEEPMIEELDYSEYELAAHDPATCVMLCSEEPTGMDIVMITPPRPSPEWESDIESLSGVILSGSGEETSPDHTEIAISSLRSLPNGVHDTLHVDRGAKRAWVERCVGTYEYTGEETLHNDQENDLFIRWGCSELQEKSVGNNDRLALLNTHFPAGLDMKQSQRSLSGNAPSFLINITLPKAQFPNAESVCSWLREQSEKGTPVRAIYQLYTPVEEELPYDDYLLRTYPRRTNIRFSNGNERIDPEMTVVVKTKAV